jgi:hypothetical protein
MVFPTGSIFIFRTWVCEVDDEGNLQGCLVEAQEAHEELTFSTGSTEDLTKRFSSLIVSESTQALMATKLNLVSGLDSSSGSNPCSFRDKLSSFLIRLQNTTSTFQGINSSLFQGSSRKLGRLPIGLDNVARTYQDLLRETAGPVRRLWLTEVHEGLILTITSQDCLVHWPKTFSQSSNTRLVDEAITLPYQEGNTSCDADALTKVIGDSSGTGVVQAREVLMIR